MTEKKPVIAQDTIDEINQGKIKLPTNEAYDAADEFGESRMRPPAPVVKTEKSEKKPA